MPETNTLATDHCVPSKSPLLSLTIEEFIAHIAKKNAYLETHRKATCETLLSHITTTAQLYDIYRSGTPREFGDKLDAWGIVDIAITKCRQAFAGIEKSSGGLDDDGDDEEF